MILRSVLLVLSLGLCTSLQALEVRINDSRENNFYMDALVWVLDKSGTEYSIVRTDHPISTQKRKVAFVLNKEIDVIYAGTTQKLEDTLQPVRFPITRGLIGKRLFVINHKYRDNYQQIRNAEDLKENIAALGYEWPEVEIFAAAQLRYTEKIYDDIFTALDRGSRYYFPRGVLEAFSELKNKQQVLTNLAVEEHLLLQYKSAVFFFVHPDNQALLDALQAGFVNAYRDGSYKTFFYSHPLIKESFTKAQLDKRTVITIPNPYFPTGSNNIPAEYWH